MLLLKDKALDAMQEGCTIADFADPNMPLIYANEGFAKITGYKVSEAMGLNCRFLQVRRRARAHVFGVAPAVQTLLCKGARLFKQCFERTRHPAHMLVGAQHVCLVDCGVDL